MTDIHSKLPGWILIVSGLVALLEISVSIFLILAPESVLETVDLKAKGVEYLIRMWAARQFALGFIFGFATMKKSAPMLSIAYIFFLVMMLGDLLIGIFQKENPLIIGALVMTVIASVMLYAINKKK